MKMLPDYIKWCWEHGVKIYPEPITPCGTKCKIIIDYGTRIERGTEVYEKTAKHVNKQVNTSAGAVNTKIVIPALYDKINELYKNIYLKNNPDESECNTSTN